MPADRVNVVHDHPGQGRLRLRFFIDDHALSFRDALQRMEADGGFREVLSSALRSAPYRAFRWETPPLGHDTSEQDFVCLLHDSPRLDVPADATDFSAHFNDNLVVSFDNLGGDALMVAPCPVSNNANYSHFAAFLRTAPREQRDAIWVEAARQVLARLGPSPLWLSTAGGGVDWLHLRLDQRPKYYQYAPWRRWPQ